MSYNGWTNYDTWNVMLHIDNDEYLYKRKMAFFQECLRNDITNPRYDSLIKSIGLLGGRTMDGVSYNSEELDKQQLDDSVYGEFQEWKEYNA